MHNHLLKIYLEQRIGGILNIRKIEVSLRWIDCIIQTTIMLRLFLKVYYIQSNLKMIWLELIKAI